MPVREKDRREQEIAQLKLQLELWDKHLRDRDWIERILVNSDWKRLCELFQEGVQLSKHPLEEAVRLLCNEPMPADKRIVLAEQVMLMNRDAQAVENIINFPARETKRLEEIGKEYPKLEARLRELQATDSKEESYA